jgi:hypothetical protein
MLAGTYMGAPGWKVEADSNQGQSVLVEYKGQGALSHVSWYKGTNKYYESPTVPASMKSGFAMTAFGDDFVEAARECTFSAPKGELREIRDQPLRSPKSIIGSSTSPAQPAGKRPRLT